MKERLKNKLRSKVKYSANPVFRCVWAFLHVAKSVLRVIFIPAVRSQWIMETFQKDRVQQTTQRTWANRYPEIFAACRDFFAKQNKKNIRILSYVCCTGEEVVTLREYFPDAVIVGAELNRDSLRICRKRKCDSNIHFIYSKPENIRKYGPYDAVFCMAVLERLPMEVIRKHITDLKDMYPFEKYNAHLHEIDTYVKDGGLLIAHNTHYDIMDTDLASGYSALGSHGFTGMIFDRDSKLKKDNEFQQSIFIKKTSC